MTNDPKIELFDFKDGFDFDSGAGGDLGEAQGAAGVVAVGGFAVDFVQEVAAAVDDQVLVCEIRGGVDAAQQFEDLQAVERAVEVPDGVQDLYGAVAGGFFAFLDRGALPQLAFQVTDMAGGDEQVARAYDQGEVAGFLFGEGDTERFGFFLGSHWRVIPLSGIQ